MIKSFLIFVTLLGLTACCGCGGQSKAIAHKSMSGVAAIEQSHPLSCSSAKVSGMTCEACAMTVTENLKKIKGVKDVKVDVPAGQVKIYSIAPSDVSKKSVQSTIEKSGYQFLSLQSRCN